MQSPARSDPPITAEARRRPRALSPEEYERILRHSGPRAHLHRAGRVQRAVVGALRLQELQAAAAPAAHQRALGAAGSGRKCRRDRPRRWLGASHSRSSRTITHRRSSPIRAQPRAWAAFCATCSPWARDRSRCSTRCASVDLASARVRYLFAGVVKGIGDYGNCVGIPNLGGEVYFDDAYEGQSAGQCDGHRA